MDAIFAASAERNEGRLREERVTITAYLLRALTLTLVEHPAFNAVWDGDSLVQVDAVNIGVAISLHDGLLAPALLGCGDRSVEDLARGLGELVARTRAGRLRAPEINEATFTLSNLGMFDVSGFTAIITPPQVAVLAAARPVNRWVVSKDVPELTAVMTATLSADHRAVDGADAARFLETFKDAMQNPETLLPASNDRKEGI